MKIDIKKRYSFKTKIELTKYLLENNYELLDEDISHILLRMNEKHKKLKIYKAICFLMENLKGEQKEALIALINADFEFGLAYSINCDFLDKNFLKDEFVGYAFKSVNKETEKYLISLVKKIKENKSTANLNKFKEVIGV